MNTRDDVALWHGQRARSAQRDPVAYARAWEPHEPLEGRIAPRLMRAIAWVLIGAALGLLLGCWA